MDKLNNIKIFLLENKKKIIVFTCLLLVMLAVTILFLNKNSYKTESVVYQNLLKESSSSQKESPEVEHYYVDIKGEVEVPGVYSLDKGKRVVDAINVAGGVKESGDTSLLNLSMELRDGMVIIVYSKDEIKAYTLNPVKNTKEEAICNKEVINDACSVNSNKDIITNIPDKTIIKDETLKESSIKTDSKNTESNENTNSSSTSNVSSKININTASAKELTALPRIGDAKAKAIVDYRSKNGNFQTIEDIKKVSGIGDATFEQLKDQITV